MDVFNKVKRSAAVTLTLALASTAGAAGVISLNFTDGAGAGQILAPTDVAGAGAYAQDNWNNASNKVGTTDPNSLTDDDGATTGASVTWAARNTWRATRYNTASVSVSTSPNHAMMFGYLDDGTTASLIGSVIDISDIPYQSYKIVVYSSTDSGDMGRIYAENNGVRVSYNAYGKYDATSIEDPYVLTEATGDASHSNTADTPVANYAVFTGVEGSDSITIRGVRGGSARGTIAAIQIVEITAGTGISGIAGDFNSSGSVDAADYDIWRANYGTTGFIADGDANYDSVIDLKDFVIIRNAVLANSGVDLLTIPEPTSMAMLALGATALIRRKRA